MKKNFKVHDPVKIVNMPVGCILTGKTGKILGKATDHSEFNSWIVWLNIPTETHKAIVLTEACLELE